jgi:hypothetical protein
VRGAAQRTPRVTSAHQGGSAMFVPRFTRPPKAYRRRGFVAKRPRRAFDFVLALEFVFEFCFLF